MKGLSVSGFADDVSMGTESAAELLVELRKVLSKVRDSGMKLKLSRCTFGCRGVEVLGHSVTPGGIMPSKDHVEAIKNLRELKDGAELLRFLGLADYFA